MPTADNHNNLALGALAAAIGMASGSASAATYTVTSNSPAGPGSLSLAMALANANAGADTINIAATGTIDLTGLVLPSIYYGGLTISGPGADTLTIVGNTTEVPVFRAYEGGSFTLSGMTISGASNGVVRANNGVVLSIDDVNMIDSVHNADLIRTNEGGSVSISESAFENNVSNSYANVLDIYNADNVTISNTVISGNSTGDDIVQFAQLGEGAFLTNVQVTDNVSNEGSSGISLFSSDLTLQGSEISGNTTESRGGALRARYANVSISDSRFANNTSGNSGGAIDAGYINLDISGSVFVGNTAYEGGAIRTSSFGATVAIESSSFVGNSVTGSYEGSGGALNLNHGSAGSISISGSLFKDNESSGSDGAISVSAGEFDISDSVLSGNTSRFGVGGIDIDMAYNGSGTMARTVVDGNSSEYGTGGVRVRSGAYGNFTIYDSTISDNTTLTGEGSPSGMHVVLEAGVGDFSTVTVGNSTVSGNSGPFAAVEVDDQSDGYGYYRNAFNVANSTFSGNSSTTQRVPIVFDGVTDAVISHSTFVDNTGVGVDTAQAHFEPRFSGTQYTSVFLENTVFASSNDSEVIFNGSALSQAGGFLGGTNTMSVTSVGAVVMAQGFLDYGGGDTSFGGPAPAEVDPELGPLSDNGGPTLTHAPSSATSYVVDAGPAQARPNGEDQRGVAPAGGDVNADLGAVEYLDPAVNTAPRLAVNIGKQLAGRVGREIPGITVADAFTDAEGDTISVDSVVGLPGGLTFDGTDISGELAVAGDFIVTVTVSDDGSPSLSTTEQFNVRISEEKSGLSNAEIAALLDDDDGGSVPLTFLSTLAAMAWLRRRRQ